MIQSGSIAGFYMRFKPHILMIIAQIGYTFMYIVTEASFNHGMDPFVYVTYRHIVATLIMFPFAYFIERKIRPKLTLALFLEIFVLSLLGVSLTLNMYFTSMKYTSPTILACMVNTLASLTFILAVILCSAITDDMDEFCRAAQSAVFTAVVQHKQAAWTIGFNIDLLSILYGGIVISGMVVFFQLWCTQAKGPVFVTMFNPLSTLLVAFLAYFVLGEKLHVGSILGGIIVIIGLYMLLWGKEHDEARIKPKETQGPETLTFTTNENSLKREP